MINNDNDNTKNNIIINNNIINNDNDNIRSLCVHCRCRFCTYNKEQILRFCFDRFDLDKSGALDEREFMQMV